MEGRARNGIDVSAQDAYRAYNNKLKQSVDKDKLPKDVKSGTFAGVGQPAGEGSGGQ
ncbi:MAG: hypothetical protein MRJ92_08155 [Nitrospira sp.]|nr:hypothetical protein [Nitrospira sp.]